MLLSCAVCLAATSAAAAEPAAENIAKTVDQSTHIVVGTVRNVSVVSFYNDILYRLNPEPRLLTSYTAAQLQMDIDEVLYPRNWKPEKGAKYLFGDGLFPVAQIRDETLGQRRIYFLRVQEGGKIVDRDYIFFAADEWPLGLPEKYREPVKRAIEARLRRERS